MPRARRCDVAEHVYHALNRGDQRGRSTGAWHFVPYYGWDDFMAIIDVIRHSR